MDKNRFDGFTRQLAKRENRRQAIKSLLAGGAGTATAIIVGKEAEAAKPGSASDCCPASAPRLCGLTCTSIVTDSQNCGSCGHQCSTGQTCVDGTCAPAVTKCKKTKNCPSGQTCTNGVCTAPTPQCSTAADCPGTDTDCQNRTCLDGTCGFAYAPTGMPITAQVSGDCQRSVCDGSGGITSQLDDTDTPSLGACFTGVCSDGNPSQTPVAAGMPCRDGICDGEGNCVQCLDASYCPPSEVPNTVTTCVSGNCSYQCIDGYTECIPNGGGCVDTSVDINHCGGCNRPCSVNNGIGVCNNGTCGIAACNPGFLDCDGLVETGCEVDGSMDSDNCGQCGNVCGNGSCQNGECV